MWGAGCRRPGEAAGTPRGRAGRRIVARDGRVIVGGALVARSRSRARRRALAHCSRGTAAGLPVRFDFSRDAPCRVSAGPGGRVYAHPRSTARLRVEEGMEVSVSRSLALRRRARGPKPRWCAGNEQRPRAAKSHAPFLRSRVGATAESERCPSFAGAGAGSVTSGRISSADCVLRMPSVAAPTSASRPDTPISRQTSERPRASPVPTLTAARLRETVTFGEAREVVRGRTDERGLALGASGLRVRVVTGARECGDALCHPIYLTLSPV